MKNLVKFQKIKCLYNKHLQRVFLYQGQVFIDGNLVVVSHFADAQVDTKRGVVICSTVADKFPSLPNTLFGNGVYHSLDYVLYYYNIRENAQKRVRSYFKRKEGS